MTHSDDDDEKPNRLPLGDIGTILLAGVFLVGMLYMMFGPNPLDGVFKPAPPKEDSGVVTVTLPPKN
jgi:hypothetical protein